MNFDLEKFQKENPKASQVPEWMKRIDVDVETGHVKGLF